MSNVDKIDKKNAHFNECKGNLFEFLLGRELSVRSGLEAEFLLNLSSDLKNKLRIYEEFLRIHAPYFLNKLPDLAFQTSLKVWEDLSLENYPFIEWNVIGKWVQGETRKNWNETDLVGTYRNQEGEAKNISLSLKLIKENSFTNTKSAGVKSFLIKYFKGPKYEIPEFQKELNECVDDSFLKMGHQLYALRNREFEGSFEAGWKNEFSELPGELPDDLRVIVHQNYHRVALKLTEFLTKIKEIDEDLFLNSLASLCGFGHPDIIQVICFHYKDDLKEVAIKKWSDFFPSSNKRPIAIIPVKEMSSFCEIMIGKIHLQIRVKPMNKYTTNSYKINCSIKGFL